MSHRLRWAAAGLAAVIVFVTGLTTALPSAKATSSGPAVGVQFHATWSSYTDAQRTAVLDKLQAAGVKWVRVDAGWASIEPAGPGQVNQWYVDLLDRVVDQARARGINVLLTLWLTPGWANGGAGTIAPPGNVADYARVAGWAAAHFKGRVGAWEIWNEPNMSGFWSGSVAQYVSLLKVAYPAIKAADPSAQVVLGGPSENDTTWLAAAYAAGMQGSFDVMATHPYMGVADAPPETPDDGTIYTLSHVSAVRSLMVQNGDASKPIWFTELGWSTHDNWSGVPNWDRGVTLSQQADYVVRTLKYVQSNYPYVTNVFWYEERNDTSGNVQLDNYGLLYNDLTPKPAFTALQSYLTGGSATSTTTTTTTTAATTTTSAPPPTTTTTTTTTATSTTAAPPPTTTGNQPPAGTNLLADGSFEGGLGAWGSWQGTVSLASDGKVGPGAAKVTRLSGSAFSIYRWPRPVLSTSAGAVYHAGGWIRSDSPGRRVCLYVREWSTTGVVGTSSNCVKTTTQWQAFPALVYTKRKAGGSLEAFVMQPSGASTGDSFEVDGLTLS
jgi:cell division septation protein DedD